MIIGGALYANRWPRSVRRFVNRHVAQLRRVPVWLFSSGPLDDSAERQELPASTQVAVLGERIGANGHVTFGGRLEADVKGFPESAMAKTSSGDWRNPDRIRAWAAQLAAELPGAKPGKPIEHAGRSLPRQLGHGAMGWALCAAIVGLMLEVASVTATMVGHAILAPLIFTAVAWHYFRARGSRDPLATSVIWIAIVMLLDLLVVGFQMFQSIAGAWLPFTLIFLATWGTGGLMSTMPWPKSPEKPSREPPGQSHPALTKAA